MAKQTRKIRNHIIPRDTNDTKPVKKVGKDYLLIGVIIFTVTVLLIGWNEFDNTGRALYITLGSSLLCTYARRHIPMNEYVGIWVDRASMVFVGLALALFGFMVYDQYIK